MTEIEAMAPPEQPPAPPPPEAISVLLPLVGAPTLLEPLLDAWVRYLPTLGREWELLVLDDGAHDRALLDAWSADKPSVQFLAADNLRSLGTLLRGGLEAARHPLLFYATLDYPYEPSDLSELLKRIDEADPESGLKLDIVNGCRAGRPTPVLARICGALWRGCWNLLLDLHLQPSPGWLGLRWGWLGFWTRLLFGLRLRDSASGFKLFRKKIFARIPLQSDGPFVAIEILAKANFLGCFMDELPIASEVGKSSPPIPRLGSIRSDFRKVFAKPDFGPPVLATPPEATLHAESH